MDKRRKMREAVDRDSDLNGENEDAVCESGGRGEGLWSWNGGVVFERPSKVS